MSEGTGRFFPTVSRVCVCGCEHVVHRYSRALQRSIWIQCARCNRHLGWFWWRRQTETVSLKPFLKELRAADDPLQAAEEVVRRELARGAPQEVVEFLDTLTAHVDRKRGEGYLFCPNGGWKE